MTLHAGERLGPYEILGGLGAGAMGEVFRARDPRLGRAVAIKVLPASLSADASRRHRFEHEARAAGQLNHPNILAVYDVGDREGAPYLVAELLEGETLRERLQAGALPVRKAADYALQVARGLAAAHDKGIVHRDLKPENLFLTKDGIVKILDFGLARLERPAEPGSTATATVTTGTEPGTVMGTVGYMSPEQVRGEAADHRSDVFALGVVFYEMLTGRRAFHRDSSVETLNAILKEEPEEFPPDRQVPPALDRVVRHCLEKKPEDRYQSVRDLAFELQGWTGSGVTTAKAGAPASGRWRRWLTRAAVASVALAALAGSFLAGRRTAPPTIPSYRQLTFRRGAVGSARFTPDGQTVLYSAAWDGQPPAIASRRIDGPESKPLGLPPGHVASVSSKGELAIVLTPQLAYNETPGTLARVPLSGGVPREVADDVWCADWAPDGEGLVVRRTPGPWRIEYPIGHVISPFSFGCPRFSPDGRSIAIPMPDGYAVVDAASGRRTLVTGVSDYGHEYFWAWSPPGDEIWFSGSDDPEQRSLQAVSLKGRRRLLGRIAGAASLFDVSRDGRMLIEHSVTRFGVRGRAPGETAERELTIFDHTALIDLSLDGRVALLSEWGSAAVSASATYLRATNAADPVRLGKGDPLSLSPDGRWFAERIGPRFQSPESWQGTRLRLVPTGAGEARELPFPDHIIHWAGWLPDGQRLILTARERISTLKVFVSGLDGSGLRAITPDGVFPRAAATDGWMTPASDGRRVAVEAPNGAVTLYPVDGPDPPREVPGLGAGFHAIRFSDDGRRLFVTPHQGTPTRVFRVDLATGQRTLVHELMLPDPDGVTTFASGLVTPDGRAYAYGYRQVLGNLYLAQGLR
jgi:hypothetical protein